MKKNILLLAISCLSSAHALPRPSDRNTTHKLPVMVASLKSEKFRSNNKMVRPFALVRGPLSCDHAIFIQGIVLAVAIRDRTHNGQWLNRPQQK